MQHLESLNTLINAASKMAGSDAKLAQALGVPKQHVSNWRHGKKTCQPEDQALMAALAGFDPVQTLARATVEYWEGKPKGDRLMRALGKALPAIGAAIGSAGAAAHQIGSMIPADMLVRITQCAVTLVRRHKNRYVKRFQLENM